MRNPSWRQLTVEGTKQILSDGRKLTAQEIADELKELWEYRRFCPTGRSVAGVLRSETWISCVYNKRKLYYI